MRKLIIITMVLLGALACDAQDVSSPLKGDQPTPLGTLTNTSKVLANYNSLSSKNELYQALQADSVISTLTTDNDYNTDNDKAILVLSYGLTEDSGELTVDKSKITQALLHQNRDTYNDAKGWSSYLYHVREIMVVLVGEDFPVESLVSSLEIDLKQGSFGSDVEAFSEIWKQVAKVDSDSVKGFGFILTREQLKPPYNLKLEVPLKDDKTKELSFDVHERSRFALKAGLAGRFVEAENFTLENNELTFELDSAGQEDFKANGMAILEFYPFGRDLDRYEFILKDKNPFKSIPHRLALNGGVAISDKPLDNLYVGASFALSRGISVFGGAHWSQQTPDNTTVNVGATKSLSQAREYLPTSYAKPKLMMGISFSPSEALKIMGLGKDDSSDDSSD